MKISRDDATTWATWFQALGDPSRILILHLLATEGRPMAVGEVTDTLGLAQSTVSHHLAKLAAVRFVLVESVGNSNRYRVNAPCLQCFPSAAEMVMGGRVPARFVKATCTT